MAAALVAVVEATAVVVAALDMRMVGQSKMFSVEIKKAAAHSGLKQYEIDAFNS